MTTKRKKNDRGLYRASVCTGQYDARGNPIRKYITAKTISELEAKQAKLRQDIREQRNIFDESITFGRYASKWFTTYKKNKGVRTQEMYSRILNNHLAPLNDIKIVVINRTGIQNIINDNSEHPRTCEQMLLALKQIFDSAVDDGIITKTPVKDIELPRHVPQVVRRALTAEELQAVKSAELDPRQRAFISLLLGCGLRPAEAYALTWSDIDFQNQTVNINKALVFSADAALVDHPKTDSGIRTVEAPLFVLGDLMAYKKISKNIIVFADKKGKYRYKSRYHDEWVRIKKKIVEKLGHDTDITPYYFRHNYATALYYSGISLLEAKRLLGHSDTKMIMEIYAHLDAQKENTLQKINTIAF